MGRFVNGKVSRAAALLGAGVVLVLNCCADRADYRPANALPLGCGLKPRANFSARRLRRSPPQSGIPDRMLSGASLCPEKPVSLFRIPPAKSETVLRSRLQFRSDSLQILSSRLARLAIDHDLERDALAFTQFAQAGALDCADMDENVLAAAFRLDKSVTLLRVEPFDGSVAHGGHSFAESVFEPRKEHDPVRSRFW
jgi:hypothetical protein